MTISESQNLTLNFDFRGHLSTFRPENKPKSRTFKVQNNPQTTPEQLQTNFQKVQKTGFLNQKNCQNTSTNFGKKGRFWVHFQHLSSNISLLGLKEN